MTLLLAVKTIDGFAAVSDRKETYANRPPRNVTKYHMDKKGRVYISIAGDGVMAKGIIDRLAHARTGPADVIKKLRSVVSEVALGNNQRLLRADGILIIAGRQGLKMYDILIAGRHVDVLENVSSMSIHGDGAAQALCRYITKKVEFSGRTRETVARMMLVLASAVAEVVETVGDRSYGFDIGLFVEDGNASLLEQLTEEFGRIDVQLRLNGSTPLTSHGGRLQ